VDLQWLYLALELGWDSWKLAFACQPGPAPRRREMPARDVSPLLLEIAEAKRKLRLPADCPVVSCYEAGRDGFWLHRSSDRTRRAKPRRRFVEVWRFQEARGVVALKFAESHGGRSLHTNSRHAGPE
jgi:hypothetical protein